MSKRNTEFKFVKMDKPDDYLIKMVKLRGKGFYQYRYSRYGGYVVWSKSAPTFHSEHVIGAKGLEEDYNYQKKYYSNGKNLYLVEDNLTLNNFHDESPLMTFVDLRAVGSKSDLKKKLALIGFTDFVIPTNLSKERRYMTFLSSMCVFVASLHGYADTRELDESLEARYAGDTMETHFLSRFNNRRVCFLSKNPLEIYKNRSLDLTTIINEIDQEVIKNKQ